MPCHVECVDDMKAMSDNIVHNNYKAYKDVTVVMVDDGFHTNSMQTKYSYGVCRCCLALHKWVLYEMVLLGSNTSDVSSEWKTDTILVMNVFRPTVKHHIDYTWTMVTNTSVYSQLDTSEK